MNVIFILLAVMIFGVAFLLQQKRIAQLQQDNLILLAKLSKIKHDLTSKVSGISLLAQQISQLTSDVALKEHLSMIEDSSRDLLLKVS